MSFGRSSKENEKPSLSPLMPIMSDNPNPPGSMTTKVDAFLGKGSKVVGVLTFNSPVEIDGEIEGEVHAQDRLLVGESAVIKAKISGSEIIVKGVVHGDIHASKRLSLKRPAKVYGNISSPNISIEEGVVFEGKCSMGGNAAAGEKLALASAGEKKHGASS